MRFLRNLTADIILIGGSVVLFIMALAFGVMEVVARTGVIKWLVYGLVAWIIVKYVRRHNARAN